MLLFLAMLTSRRPVPHCLAAYAMIIQGLPPGFTADQLLMEAQICQQT